MKYIILALICLPLLTSQAQKTVAVLPFVFSDDGHLSETKGQEAQEFLINYFQKKSKHIKVECMSGRDIRVALNKAGIHMDNLDSFTTVEISEALGNPDYILMGSIQRSFEGTTSLETGFGSINDSNWKTTNVYQGSTSSTSKKYNASVNVSVFNEKGAALYEKSKGNVFIDTNPDSWKNSLIWHVRHFPFYD